MAKTKAKMKVTLVKSVIGCNERQRACVVGLGLRKLNASRIIEKTPATLGMAKKVHFLVKTEEV